MGQSTRRRYRVNHLFFTTIDTPAKAYLLGFIATDGCVTRGRLQIALKREDRTHLEKIVAATGSDVPVGDYEATCKGKKHPYSVIFFPSKPLLADLSRHGIQPRKSHTVQPWPGPETLLASYWLGVIDGDGSLFHDRRDKTWRLALVGNSYMADGFAAFLRERLAIEPKQREERGRSVIVSYWGLPSLHRILALLYDGQPLYLDRKKAKADIVRARQPRCVYHDWSQVSEEDLQALYREHGTWEKVAAHFGMTRSAISALRWSRKKRGLL